MRMLCLYFTVVIFGLTAAQTCPKGWSHFQNSCYLFPNINAAWGTALGICKHMNAYLVEIETGAENRYLERKKHNNHNYWTGGNDIEIESEWRWITSRKRFNFTDWDLMDSHNLQPNNLQSHEDCMLIYHIHHKWHDADCNSPNFFICEQSASQPLPTTQPETMMPSTTEQQGTMPTSTTEPPETMPPSTTQRPDTMTLSSTQTPDTMMPSTTEPLRTMPKSTTEPQETIPPSTMQPPDTTPPSTTQPSLMKTTTEITESTTTEAVIIIG